jgi:ribosomal protein S18 acetylase RimI-like enzyme
VAQCGDGVRALTADEGVVVVDVPPGERGALEWILEESFEGWYLRHARGKLQQLEVVRAAMVSGTPVGLVMLKTLEARVGYIYYIAVAKSHRKMGIARHLLKDSLKRFREEGVGEVYASVEIDNIPSEGLFTSEGFTQTSFGDVSKRFGTIRAINMYRMMVIVPGEALMWKKIT